jgi:predicted kinase
MGDELRVPLVLECTAPTNILLRRAEARAHDRAAVSDADAAMVIHQLGERDPPHGRWTHDHLNLCTDNALDIQVAEVETFIDRH